MFPAEGVPDGAIFAPHHYLWGLYLALLVSLVVWDDYRRREPILTVASIGIALFGWLHVWTFYPALGAGMSLAGTLAASITIGLDEWDAYPLRWRALALLGCLVALDDLASHAFGLWTPLDWIWGWTAPLLGVIG